MPLIIVESPTKINTLSSILDGDWSFATTKGHMYDLPADRMGFDDDYEPEWEPQDGAPVGQIRNASKSQEQVYVASDPDREGEAIAWQVDNLVLDQKKTRRVRLESLTASEVKQQLEEASETDMDLVHAQWARRLLDRLAGYKVSPFLMDAFNGKRLSAGRVQSAVLAKIVERWEAVEEFEPETYFNLFTSIQPADDDLTEPCRLALVEYDGEDIGTGDDEELLTDEDAVDKILDIVRNQGLDDLSVTEKETTSNPAFPFDSSELIRRASSWFNWSSNKTMNVAQSLYEKGLITYHRSDSTRLSKAACAKAKSYITENYGEEYHQWRGGGGGDQEGHEAIRAKSPDLEPDDLHSVSKDEYTLYSAIWQRYVRSQMTKARWRHQTVSLRSPDEEQPFRFLGTMRTIKDRGFYKCTRPDETPLPDRERPSDDLDAMDETEDVRITDVEKKESETSGPTLYTEGSLIAMMKREGIGRPSTYSSTVDRLKRRKYIEFDEGSIVPTERGRAVCNFLREAVPAICDVELTESMEDMLDEIAAGDESWRSFVKEFDEHLEEWLEEGKDVEPDGSASADGPKEELEYEVCPRCDEALYLREGQYGEFVHCSDDDCDFSSNPPAKSYECPECDRKMVKKNGKSSTVYHCIAEPECDGKRPVGKPNMTYEEFQSEAPDCPDCGKTMKMRKGRYGKFWGCPDYPDCEGTRQT
jgi:DNA topoisomerase-1